MKIPNLPPNTENYYETSTLLKDKDNLIKLLSITGPVDSKGRYLHWDELRFRPPSKPYSIQDIWYGTKIARMLITKSLPLSDIEGRSLRFCTPDGVLRQLHDIDQNAGGGLITDNASKQTQISKTYLLNSLIEEAISSSQLEGASTTRKVAKSMLRNQRQPRDKSERMIFNNFNAMQFVREEKDTELSPELICEIHRIVTERTLDDPSSAGRLRTSSEPVQVISAEGNILHTPPKASQLSKRLEVLCEFANDSSVSDNFIHPIIKAAILHFQLAYEHPFVDGNGRTARALFYWYVAKHNYWLLEYSSISSIIKEAPAQYGRAFLYTETDENDLTYFIIHQLNVVEQAIEKLYKYLEKQQQRWHSAFSIIENTPLNGRLNRRQLELLDYALKTPNYIFRIKEHQHTHAIAYQTARNDLLELSEEFSLFSKLKDGRSFIFIAKPDLRYYLENLIS